MMDAWLLYWKCTHMVIHGNADMIGYIVSHFQISAILILSHMVHVVRNIAPNTCPRYTAYPACIPMVA